METTYKILDGKWLAKQVQHEIREQVAEAAPLCGRSPGLGVILVGDNPASKAYVANKEKTAKLCGFNTFDITLPASATRENVRDAIKSFNTNELIDGILLQLPLPKHLDSEELLDLISPDRDADGLHPLNQGLLMRGEGQLRPCTPLGVMKLLDLAYSNVNTATFDPSRDEIPETSLAGKRALVIGRSILVGKPMAHLLLERNATVSIAHSKTPDIESLARECDIIVAAVGSARMVKGSWIKQGAIVIDVGMNRLPDGSLTGDVDFNDAAPRAAAITPVPGGVGPMTVACLILNTLYAYKRSHGLFGSASRPT